MGFSVPEPASSDIRTNIHRRLLREVPMINEAEARERGVDHNPNFIWLTTDDGVRLLPTFQIGRTNAILPVVDYVNQRLLAAQDPWGVCDWWVGGHAAIGKAPVELLRPNLEVPVEERLQTLRQLADSINDYC